MKKTILTITCCLLALGVLAGCGKTKVNDNNQSNTESNNQTNDNEQETVTRELMGYNYTFEKYTLGMQESENIYQRVSMYYFVYVYYFDDINFDSWDNITDITFKYFEDAFERAYELEPTKEINVKKEKIKNKYGETILKVSGTMEIEQSDKSTEKRFVAIYHITDDNKIRCVIELPKSEFDELDEVIDLVIDNLHKV